MSRPEPALHSAVNASTDTASSAAHAVLIAVLGTLPFTQVGAVPDVVLALPLFVRGIGFGAATVTLVTAAYRDIDQAQLPRATSALQIGQRIGAPFGAAVIAVVLQHQLVAAPPATAYATTFWWTLVLTAPALLPVVFLRRSVRR